VAIVSVPILGQDGSTYYVACDASGGSAANAAGGGLVQIDGNMARYALLLTSSSGTGPTTWLPDATHQAVRAVAIINGSATPQTAMLTLYDSFGNATTSQFFQMVLPGGGVPIMLNYPLTNGVTWALDVALTAGAPIALLVN
jgi:hypothetical protein